MEVPFIAHHRNRTLVKGVASGVALLCAALYGAGALSGLGLVSPFDGSMRWLSWALVAACLIILFSIIRSSWKNEDIFQLDHQGAKVAGWSDQTIPWSEVTDVNVWASPYATFVMLTLAHPDRFPGKGGWRKVNFEKASGGHIPLAVTLSDRTVDETLAAIDYFRKYAAQ